MGKKFITFVASSKGSTETGTPPARTAGQCACTPTLRTPKLDHTFPVRVLALMRRHDRHARQGGGERIIGSPWSNMLQVAPAHSFWLQAPSTRTIVLAFPTSSEVVLDRKPFISFSHQHCEHMKHSRSHWQCSIDHFMDMGR